MSKQIVHFNKLKNCQIELDTSEITSVSNINGFQNKTIDIITEYIKKNNNYQIKKTDYSYDDNLYSDINRNLNERRFNIKIDNNKQLTDLINDISYIMDKINNEVSDLVVKNNLEHTKEIDNYRAMVSVIPSYNDSHSGWSELGPAESGFNNNISDDGYPLYAVNVKIV